MRRDKEVTSPQNRATAKFRDFRVHSESLDDYFVDSEPSNRVQAESDGTHNKADVAYEQLVKGNVWPNASKSGLKNNTDRRLK